MIAAYSTLGKMVKKYGFKQKSPRLYYLEKEDIIAFFSFECPSGGIHVQFGITPLYLPSSNGVLFYTYGNRLNYMYHDLRYLNKTDLPEQINAWCMRAEQHIVKDILPLVNSLSTAAGVIRFVRERKPHAVPEVIWCSQDNLYYLLSFSELYCQHIPEARQAAYLYLQSLQTKPYTEAAKEESKREMTQVLEMMDDPEKLQAAFAVWREENKSLFIKKKKA